MQSVCLYFHVHQPYRIKRYRVFDVGIDHNYFNDTSESDLNNLKVLGKVAQKSYVPANAILESLLKKHPDFKFALSFSGILINQLEEHFPSVLDSFKRLVATGRVELLADTYHHSLSFFYSEKEFSRQVQQHQKILKRIFGYTPTVFRNTELSYNNALATWAETHGFRGILAEGWDGVLAWRSPNFLYRPPGCKRIKVLLKNYRLSDDIAFRFGEKSWKGWPLDANKFANWIHALHGDSHTVNLFMDFETFGEHQWEDTGIFHFLQKFPESILLHPDTSFKTPSETVAAYPTLGEIDVPGVLTWADTERDLTAWTGNEIQKHAINTLYALEENVFKTGNKDIIEDWRRLQTSDHFYYMCTKWFADGDVHTYFSPYDSPYDAHISYMNVLLDLKIRVENCLKKKSKQKKRKNFIMQER